MLEPGNVDPQSLPSADKVPKGRLPAEQIQQTVRAAFDAYRACYEGGLARDRKLTGRVDVRFVIARDGSLPFALVRPQADAPLRDPEVLSCLQGEFEKLTFPPPVGGIVRVAYPLNFMPTTKEAGEAEASAK
jgi:hypothetical protein